MTIAITGATGQLGQLVIEGLKTKLAPSDIIALARNPDKARGLGVTTRIANYDEPSTLVAAFQGVDKVLLISANEVGKRTPQHTNVINAAREAGVKHVFYTSLLHADTSLLNLASEHKETEALLKASGLTYTILRNGWYTENYTGALGGAIAAGALVGSVGNGKIASAARKDYAAAAVAALSGTGHENKTYELVGDTAWTMTELAAEVSRQTGKNLPYHNLAEAEYAEILVKAGLPAPLSAAIASWDVAASKGALYDDSKQLSQLIGRPTTTLEAAVREALAG